MSEQYSPYVLINRTKEGYLVATYPITNARTVRTIKFEDVQKEPEIVQKSLAAYDQYRSSNKLLLDYSEMECWLKITDEMRAAVGVYKKYCSECSTLRSGDVCFKCGTTLFVPAAGWIEPAIPDVEPIRKIARELGYAIGEHGTKEADLDLIAIPWVADAVSAPVFVRQLAERLGAHVLETEDKPMGRFAACIQLDGYFKLIDLSVMGPNWRHHYYGEEKVMPGMGYQQPPTCGHLTNVPTTAKYRAADCKMITKIDGVQHVYTNDNRSYPGGTK